MAVLMEASEAGPARKVSEMWVREISGHDHGVSVPGHFLWPRSSLPRPQSLPQAADANQAKRECAACYLLGSWPQACLLGSWVLASYRFLSEHPRAPWPPLGQHWQHLQPPRG